MLYYEFRLYSSDAEFLRTVLDTAPHVVSAKQKAGRWAKCYDGPVDLARATDEPWDERYITTASPCEFRACGYRLERLDV